MKWCIGSVLVARIALSVYSYFCASKAKGILDNSIKIALLERGANLQVISSILAVAFWGLIIVYLLHKRHSS